MIKYANIHTQAQVRQMWKTVFGDSDAYMDIYFREKYRDERTLVYLEGGKVVASLQMLPYNFTFCDTEIPVAYISGVSTLPEARKKDYMRQLLLKSFDKMAKNGVSLAILVPQETWLLRFYEKYGFAQTFDAGTNEQPSLKELLNKHSQNMEEAYGEFDNWCRQKDMTVQKTCDDFRAIIEEAALFDFPPKKNLIGMARIIDAEKLLSVFAKKYIYSRFTVIVGDEVLAGNTASFSIENGNVRRETSLLNPAFHINIRELTQLLFGYHTSKKEEPFRSLFPEKAPEINFMLE